jgi:hypothetical protein
MATVTTPVPDEYAGGTVARAQVGLWRDGFVEVAPSEDLYTSQAHP